MSNTFVINSRNTASSSKLRFVSSPSQPQRGMPADASTLTRSVATFVHTLSGPLQSGWALREPISLIVEPDGESYVASESITTVYGCGDTGSDAIVDYIVSLCEYYELLEASNTIEAYQQLDRLGRYLIKTHN